MRSRFYAGVDMAAATEVRIVTTWWELNNGVLHLLEPGEPRREWEIRLPLNGQRGRVRWRSENDEGESDVEEISTTVTPNFGRYAVGMHEYRTAMIGPDELDIRFRLTGAQQEFQERLLAAQYLREAYLRPARQGVNWNGPWDVRADMERIADTMDDALRGFIHTPVFDNQPNPAVEKSKSLLLSFLSPEQQGQLSKTGKFKVTAPSETVYELDSRSRNYNIVDWTHGKRLCAVLGGNPFEHGYREMPIFDQLLAQMLMIETDEAKFLQIANSKPSWLNGTWQDELNGYTER